MLYLKLQDSLVIDNTPPNFRDNISYSETFEQSTDNYGNNCQARVQVLSQSQSLFKSQPQGLSQSLTWTRSLGL